MLFNKYKSKINYEDIAAEMKELSADAAENLIQSFIETGVYSDYDLDNAAKLIANNFYAYCITLIRDAIRYKLDVPDPDKETKAMISVFAKNNGMTDKFIEGMILDKSSVIFKKNIGEELCNQFSLALGPNAPADIFDGYFDSLCACATEWVRKEEGANA